MSLPLTVARPPGGYTAPSTRELHAGAARVGITPGLGRSLCGHGPPAYHAAGWLGRLWANALVLDDGRGQHVALVQVDLHGGSRYLHEEVARRVAPETGLTTDRIFLLASHTHRGPGYLYGSLSYDRTTGTSRTESDADWTSHFDKDTTDAIAGRIAQAISEAWRARVPARVGVGSGLAWGWLWNRSGRGFDGVQLDGADADAFLDQDANAVPRLDTAQARALGRRLSGGAEPPELDDLWQLRARESFTPGQVAAAEQALRDRAGDQADEILAELRRIEAEALTRAATAAGPLLEADGLPVFPAMIADAIAMVEDPADSYDIVALARTLRADAPATDTLDHLLREQFDKGAFDGGTWGALKVVLNAVNAADWRRVHERLPLDKWLVDARVQAIWAEAKADGRPLALLGLVNATPTLIGGKHAFYCGDVNVIAAQQLAHRWAADPARAEAPPPVVGLGGGALGDVNVVPRDKDAAQIRDDAPKLDEAWQSALRAGDALARALLDAADQARQGARDDARLAVAYAELQVPGAEVTPPGSAPQKLSTRGLFGASTLRGSDLGNSPLIAVLQEGLFARKPNHWMKDLSAQDWHAQRPKYALPRLEHPPPHFPLRLLTLLAPDGQAAWLQVVGVPAEISTMLATQLREDLAAATPGQPTVLVASPVGEFGGYVGTAWEYLSQSYEASSTLFGRWSGEWTRQQVLALARGGPTVTPSGVAEFSSRAMAATPLVFIGDKKKTLPNGAYKHPELRSPVMAAWWKRGKRDGGGFDLADQPLGALDLVGSWRGGRSRGAPHLWADVALRLERQQGTQWLPVTVAGRPVDDHAVSAAVWHEPVDDDKAVWAFRLVLPARPDGLSPQQAGNPRTYGLRLAGFLFSDGKARRLLPSGQLQHVGGGVA